MDNKVNVYIKVSEDGKIPSYGSLNAAGVIYMLQSIWR